MYEFSFGKELDNGKLVCKLYDNSLIVKCSDGYIRITEYEEN